LVSCLGFEPSAFITKIWLCPFSPVSTYAIIPPSGEYDGWRPRVEMAVLFVPSGSIVVMPGPPEAENAILPLEPGNAAPAGAARASAAASAVSAILEATFPGAEPLDMRAILTARLASAYP
jgi:hypothetical protein